jgi:hypothetical protein
MADRDGLAAHEDLLHPYPRDLPTLGHMQCVRPRPRPCAEIGERFGQPRVLRLAGGSRFQRLQFGLHRVVPLAEFRHSATKLFQAHQTFPIGDRRPVHDLGQDCARAGDRLVAVAREARPLFATRQSRGFHAHPGRPRRTSGVRGLLRGPNPEYACYECVRPKRERTRGGKPPAPASRMIRGGGWKHVRKGDGAEFLYDPRNGPGETPNPAGVAAARAWRASAQAFGNNWPNKPPGRAGSSAGCIHFADWRMILL